MNNVYERMQIINLLRNSMIKHHDGEDMTLQAGPKSILEYINISKVKSAYGKLSFNITIILLKLNSILNCSVFDFTI